MIPAKGPELSAKLLEHLEVVAARRQIAFGLRIAQRAANGKQHLEHGLERDVELRLAGNAGRLEHVPGCSERLRAGNVRRVM